MGSFIRRPIAIAAIGALGWSLIGAALVDPPSAWPQPAAGGSALAWLRSAATAPRRVSYEGTKTVAVWAGAVRASQVRVYHRAPDRTRLEYPAAGNQPARVVVIAGRTQVEFTPSTNQVIRRPAPPPDAEGLTRQILPQIAENYTVRFDGTGQVAGRTARIIDVESKFPDRPRLRIWVDVPTRLILRFERYGPGGALREESAFISVQMNPVFAPDLFAVAPPPGAQVETRRAPAPLTIEQIAARVRFTPQLPAYLPPGYTLVRSRVFTIRGVPTAAFAFSDGVATLTLFESRGPQGPPPNARRVQIGSTQGTLAARGVASVLHWNARGVSFTLVGDLPEPEMVRVGASVPPAGTSRARPGWTEPIEAWLAGLVRTPAAEAAPRTGGAAVPGLPPVPISPYITNDTHPIGPGIRPEERRIWKALRARGLAPFTVKVTVASDGVSRAPDGRLARLAWIWFVYGMDWTGGAAAALREVQTSARALTLAALAADPRVTRVALTGYYHRSGDFDGRRTDATFTAQLDRARLLDEPPGLPPDEALARAGRIWYSPALLAGALVEVPFRAHALPVGSRIRVPVLPGDRTAESAERFHGTLPERVREIKARLEGLMFGVESGGRLWRGNPLRREIALTFDDGPSPLATPLLLAILHRYGAHATFFVIGEHVRAYPYLAAEMVAGGDEVGDHTFHHPNMASVDDATVGREIGAAAAAIHGATGRRPRWFRPPGGDYTVGVVHAALRREMGVAMWTDNSGDWALPPAKVVAARVLSRAEPGAIILLHNGTLNTVRALPTILVELRRRGYALVTLSRLARDAD